MSEQLKEKIEQAKKDPEVAEELVQSTQEVQKALQPLIGDLGVEGKAIVIAELHPTLQDIFNAVLNIPKVADANTANGGIGRPINKDNLVGDNKEWYKGVIKRHFKYTTNKYKIHARNFISVVLLEDAKRLRPAIDANLTLFQIF